MAGLHNDLKDALIFLGLEQAVAAKLAAEAQKVIRRACPPLGTSALLWQRGLALNHAGGRSSALNRPSGARGPHT
jgi:hypothetical protein